MADLYRVKTVSQALNLTHGGAVTTVSNANQKLQGLLRMATILTPAAVDGSATATINILDSDGTTVYSKASLAANTKTKDLQTTPIPLSGLYTVQVVFSAAQTATDSTTTVRLLIEA